MGLEDRFRDAAARRHLAQSTVACYWSWVAAFLRFCRLNGKWRPPHEVGAAEVESFLTHLARKRQCAASTQSASRWERARWDGGAVHHMIPS